ncbi:MAG: tetratricopeptide repeat protein [Pseudonocardiaceae bacterium]
MSTGAEEVPDGAQLNIARGRATQYNVQHGDLHVHHGERSYRVDEFRPRPPSVPPSARRQPSRLLAARYQVVDFIGRDHELTQLTDWRDDPDLGLAVRLVHGPGGQGKTRLAAQFAQRCAELGWTVAQAVHHSYDTTPSFGLDTAQMAGSRGLLMIVDYAERWSVGDLLALAQDPLLWTGLPTRVLLLARSAGAWWDSLSYRLEDRYAMTSDQLPLTAMADTQASRTTVFTAARDRFAELLDVPDSGQIPAPPRLDGDGFGLVLTVHMAALAAVDAYARGNTPPADPAMLSAYLLKRERDHWQRMFDNDQRVHTSPQMMARAVFIATLTRPLPYPDGLAVLQRVAIPDTGQVLDDHQRCYPPTDPATVCEPLYPDRLGEDFLALQIPGHALTGHEPDPWADTAVARLLLSTDGDQRLPAYAPQAVTVLIEAAHRWSHIARCQLFPLLRVQPGLAVAAGGVALARLADLPDVDMGVLEAIEALLPTGRHVDLDIAIAAITASLTTHRLTTHRLAATGDPADPAHLYATLGYRLANAGRREEALGATVQAVEIYRRLVWVNPVAFEPDLASALTDLSARLSDLERRDDALGATVEAVEIYRRVAGVNPEAFEFDLSRALNNLSADLSRLGRREEALGVTVEAVEIRRRLAVVDPDAFEPDLAWALKNLSGDLSDLGRRAEALGVGWRRWRFIAGWWG